MKLRLQVTGYRLRTLGSLFVFCSLLLLPAIALAAPTDFKSLVKIFTDLLGLAVPVVASLAVLFFFWGIAKYIFSAGSEDQKKEAKNVMTWGLVAIFVMTSFYGILKLFGGGFLPNFKQYQGPQPTTGPKEDESFRDILNPETMQPYPELKQDRPGGGV